MTMTGLSSSTKADDMSESVSILSKRTKMGFSWGMILLALCLWFVPTVWTAGHGLAWHTLHGRFARFEDHQIQIPWDMWVVSSGNETLTILRQAPKYSVLHPPYGILLITRGSGPPTDMAKNYDRIAQSNEQTRGGLHSLGVRKILAGKGTGYCWESANSDLSNLYISCWFDKDTLAASYEGTTAYREEFYKVVSLISGAPY
jgi:hypothetical protein